MTKDEMTMLLRSVGCNENTVTAMENAFDLGVEYERERLASIAEKNGSDILAMQIRGRE
jgi:hypothetical protein